MNCVRCDSPLLSMLETYGAIDAPVCQSCWLDGGEYGNVHPLLAQPFYTYEPLSDGWLLKRLTRAGAAYMGGVEGQALCQVHRDIGALVWLGDKPL